MVDRAQGQKAKSFTPEKLLSISAAGLLVGIGLCGGGTMLASYSGRSVFSAVPGLLAFAGTVCLFGSLLGLVVGLVWAVLRSIFGRREI
jgi:hypothetical protein